MPKDLLYEVTLSGLEFSHVVPVYASSLEEAWQFAELEYAEAGFVVTRVQPSMKQKENQ